MYHIIFFALFFMLIYITFYEYKRFKIKKNYTLIFNLWWLLWLAVSYINIGEFYSIDLKTYIYIYIGIFAFNISIFVKKPNRKSEYSYINKDLLRILMIFEFVFLLLNVFYLIKMSLTVNMINEYWKVRFIYFGIPIGDMNTSLFSSSVQAHTYNIFKMFNLVNFLVSLGELEKKKPIRFAFVILNMLLFSVLSAGRELINYIIIFTVYAFKKKLLIKNLKYIISMCIFVLVITFLREGSLSKVYMAVITYFSGSISYFDYLLKNDDGVKYYGEILFSSIIAPIKFFLRLVGFDVSTSAVSVVGQQLMQIVQISDSNTFNKFYNALATSFYWQYKDLGVFGIALYNFIIGFAYKSLYTFFDGEYGVVLYSYLEFLMIMSIFSFKFTDLFSVFPIIVLVSFMMLTRNIKMKVVSN